MTLKSRNRIISYLFYITFAFFLLFLGLFIYSLITDRLTFPKVEDITNKSTFILFKYSPISIIVSCFIEIIFSCFTLRIILRGFEKTQSSHVLFFSLFLTALALDSFRIFIPLFNINGIFSEQLFFIGNILIFSKILAILSLMLTNYINPDEPIQNNERTCIIIIVAALFFAIFIPVNTTTILPNFAVSHGYHKLLKSLQFVVVILNAISLIFYNSDREFSQTTTIAFTIMSFGYYFLIYNTTIIGLTISTLLLFIGAYKYLKELHNQYLLYD